MEQRLLKKVSRLLLDSSRCTGCGICADACPKEAITLGMVGAVVRGAVRGDAPIVVDPAKCSYCGVCTVMCPFGSLNLEVDGEKSLPIREQEGFPEYDFTAGINEDKCVRCTTCGEVCDHNAIKREVPVYEGEGGEALRQTALAADVSFTVNKDKCNVCGICGSLCPAITVERAPFNARTVKPAGEVLWDEAQCNACNVCADACPTDAIAVARTVKPESKLAGKVVIDKDECITCSWCKTVCPSEAITITKFFEGEVTFNQEKCPGGCSTCLDVCPCKAIYLPTPIPARFLKLDSIEDKIAVNHDLCILCGACVNACPSEDAITLKRTAVHVVGKETDLFKKISAKLCVPR
ncbi:MAG: 4Fe-4S binding protein, partial [Methanocorpusculum sp.]|nr:4Fe-4S binding protein [Methanocorpusculum sp.]